jgi:hypothetical protein
VVGAGRNIDRHTRVHSQLAFEAWSVPPLATGAHAFRCAGDRNYCRRIPKLDILGRCEFARPSARRGRRAAGGAAFALARSIDGTRPARLRSSCRIRLGPGGAVAAGSIPARRAHCPRKRNGSRGSVDAPRQSAYRSARAEPNTSVELQPRRSPAEAPQPLQPRHRGGMAAASVA